MILGLDRTICSPGKRATPTQARTARLVIPSKLLAISRLNVATDRKDFVATYLQDLP